MKLVISTYATQRYDYALPNVGRRLASAIYHSKIKEGTFIFIGDKSEKIKQSALLYIRDVLPEDWKFVFIPLSLNDSDLKNYKEGAQLLIAQMQTEAFKQARKIDADYFWSIESDVLVSPNSLTVSLDMLQFDNGYYDVAMCPYPSQGGGAFLGGRGTYEKHIEEDFSIEEKDIKDDILKEIKNREKDISNNKFEPSQEWIERGEELHKIIKEAPPKANVFVANGEKWKKRGWMEYAYPAIGKGSIVPTDWVGLGCTLLSRKALALADFEGYQGQGTQDLYLGWSHWKPNNINMCAITHSICDHIIRQKNENTEEQLWEDFIHVLSYHEEQGECEGHLRQRHVPFYRHIAGEKPKQENSSKDKKANK
jgi:hypothetical protein